MSTADQAAIAVRQSNARDCLVALRDASTPLTVAEVASRTHLSRPTVDTVLQELMVHGPVQAAQPAEVSAPGRPARRFGFDTAAAVVAAVDVGTRTMNCVLADAGGTIAVHRRVAADLQDGAARINAVVDLIQSCCAELSARRESNGNSALSGGPITPSAVGIAVPGILTADHRIGQSLAIPDWVGIDLPSVLGQRLGCPVIVENDIKLAAYAEHQLGAVTPNIAFIQIGNRISVALIVDGKILQGSHRLAGELGSQRGMRWTRTSDRGQLTWSTGDDAEPLFRRAARGDLDAAAEIDRFCAEIAPKITALLLTVDPDLVVVGGGLSRAGATLLDPLRDHVHRLLMTPDKPDLVAARLTTDGAITGALGHVYEECSADIFGVLDVSPPWHRFITTRPSYPEPGNPQPDNREIDNEGTTT